MCNDKKNTRYTWCEWEEEAASIYDGEEGENECISLLLFHLLLKYK